MKTLPNWLLISGSGRNVGKTTLICNIIQQLSHLNPVGVKISSHIHPLPENSDWIIQKEDYSVIRETNINRKDSSKMLQSGAGTVFYAQGPDHRLPEILSAINEYTENRPTICESGGLRKYMVPGVYLLIKGDENQLKPGFENLETLADKVLKHTDLKTGGVEKNLIFKNNCWILKS